MDSNTVRAGGPQTEHGPRRWLILGVLCLIVLPPTIDSTVLNLAIPPIIDQLSASPSDIQWIINAYVLVFAGLLLTAGGLSDRFGRRRLLVTGLAFFGAASFLAVLAAQPWQLVLARAGMGIGAALLLPSTLSILMTTFPPSERRMATAAWATVSTSGIVLGPTAGGLLLEHFWWGSVFLINIPVAGLAIVAALVLIPESRGEQRPIDIAGVLLSITALTAIVYLIIERELDPVALLAAACALVAFLYRESRCPHPMLPLDVFRNRDFTGTCLTLLFMVFGMGAVMLMLTQYLQFVLGYGPMQAGIALLPFAVTAAVCNGLGATLGRNLANRTLIVTGLSITTVAFFLFTQADSYPWILGGMVVMGIGSGLGGPAAYAAIMNTIPLRHAGVGSALNDTVQQVGMAISIAVLGSVLAESFTAQMPMDAPAAARASIGSAFELGYDESAKTAFEAAVHTGSWVSGAFTALAAVLGAILLRSEKPEPAAKVAAE